MAEDINKLINDLKKLQKEYTALTSKKAPLFDTSNIENTKNAIDAISTSIEKAKEEALRLESGFNGVYGELQGIVSELSSTESATKKVEKTFKGISSLTRDLRNDQNGLYQLSLKDLKKRKEKLRDLDVEARYQAERVEQEYKGTKALQTGLLLGKDKKTLNEGALKVRAKSLGITVKQLKNDAAILEGKKGGFSVLQDANDELDKRIKKEEQINGLIGLGGAAVEAVGGALDKLGMGGLKNALGLNEVQDEMRSIAEERLKEIKEGLKEGEEATLSFGDKMKVLKGGVKEAGAQLIKNLKDPLAIAGFLATQLVDALMSVDKQSGALAKNFGISNSQALALNSELNTTANLSGELMVTTANLNESLITLNNRYGTFSSLNSKTLTDFTKLTKQAYLSNEAAGALQDTTFLTGKGLEESTKEFLGQSAALAAQNGLALNQKQILESVKDVSTATLLQLQGQPEALAEAVVSAKALGLSLDKVEQISSSLLNFESSIGAEMEAELLTGKQLNLEKARQAALDGKIGVVAEEIAKQVGTAAEFTEMNVIQQEALAKSVGLTRDDLAKSLMEREAMAKLSDQEGKTAQEKFNNLVKEVGLEEAKKRLGDENLENLLGQKNTQDKFNAAVEKLKEIFVSIAGPVMQIVSPIADAVGFMASLITKSMGLIKVLAGVAAVYKVIKFLSNDVYRNQILTNIASKTGLITEQQVNIQKKISQISEKGIISSKGISNMLAEKGLVTTVRENIQKRLGNQTLLKGIGLYIQQSAIKSKDFIIEKASLAFQYAKNVATGAYNVLLGIGNAIKKSGLLASIAEMAMKAFSSLSAIPFIGPILGIAGAAAAASLGYMYYSKADDYMSPGAGSGYGSRTLMGPEGAIALNDKDTVIAGTSLFDSDGGGEKMESPPNNNNTSININPLVERMSAVENVLIQILNKEGDVYIDGAKVGKTVALASSNLG